MDGSGSHDVAGPRAALSPGEMARISAEVLGASPFPALVLEIPSERIVAASPAATRLIDPDGGLVVGHLLADFTSDRPAAGPELFAGGRLNGFETFRMLRRPRGPDVKVRMWIRNFDRQPTTSFVVVVIVADDGVNRSDATDWHEAPAVVGTANSGVLVERISSDAAELFNRSVDELLGRSLLELVTEAEAANLLSALTEASATQTGITLYLHTRTEAAGSAIRCEVLLLPLEPAPSCAFVFLPMPAGMPGGRVSGELSAILLRLGRGAEVAQLARGVFRGISERTMPGVNRLTTRELEIVSRLVDGDRAPAIAEKLFLSQSTVRNHLASVFGKLGIGSQQELITIIQRAHAGEIAG